MLRVKSRTKNKKKMFILALLKLGLTYSYHVKPNFNVHKKQKKNSALPFL